MKIEVQPIRQLPPDVRRVAEEIRRWGMAHQTAHANLVERDGGVDLRAMCDVALPQATTQAHTAGSPIE